jgi:uncharacterized protein YkwD
MVVPNCLWLAHNRAARKHSIDMGTRNFFDHVNPDGQDPFARMKAAGWNPTGAYAWGENIAGVRLWTLCL